MRRFGSTTIIENADAPSEHHDCSKCEPLGLAQLHQLRGRVGRSRGGVLLLDASRKWRGDPTALERLRTLERYSMLAGFRIAMRDLEIRELEIFQSKAMVTF